MGLMHFRNINGSLTKCFENPEFKRKYDDRKLLGYLGVTVEVTYQSKCGRESGPRAQILERTYEFVS